jgi:hypothetical protein
MTPEEHADNIARWTNQGIRQAVIDEIAAAVAAEREANWIPLEAATLRLRSIAAYANTLPRRYAAGLSQLCGYGDIETAATRARGEAK